MLLRGGEEGSGLISGGTTRLPVVIAGCARVAEGTVGTVSSEQFFFLVLLPLNPHRNHS